MSCWPNLREINLHKKKFSGINTFSRMDSAATARIISGDVAGALLGALGPISTQVTRSLVKPFIQCVGYYFFCVFSFQNEAMRKKENELFIYCQATCATNTTNFLVFTWNTANMKFYKGI